MMNLYLPFLQSVPTLGVHQTGLRQIVSLSAPAMAVDLE